MTMPPMEKGAESVKPSVLPGTSQARRRLRCVLIPFSSHSTPINAQKSPSPTTAAVSIFQMKYLSVVFSSERRRRRR